MRSKKILNKSKSKYKPNRKSASRIHRIHTAENKSKKSMCAPFIMPLDLSKSKKLTKSNMNIITSATDESCFTIDALRKIASKWNATHPNMLIEYNEFTSGKKLWRSISNAMSAKCTNEVCWLKQDFIKETPLANELLKNFKPFMPKKWETNPREWLNTIDIRDVMNQYEVKHPDFEFIGPVPMDFDSRVGFGQCVVNELCNISLKSLLDKGKHKLGVVFNLDKHTESGSHWVAMWAQLSNPGGDISGNSAGEICYWDSYGMRPNPEVVKLMNRLKEQAQELEKPVIIKVNKKRHQYKNTECGVYCIYFLTSFLEGRQFEDIVGNIIDDDKMFEKRKDFFAKA
jgi:hypothetical protein